MGMFKEVISNYAALLEGAGSDDIPNPFHYEPDPEKAKELLTKHRDMFHAHSKKMVADFVKTSVAAKIASRKAYAAKRNKRKKHKQASDAHNEASIKAKHAARHMDQWEAPSHLGHTARSLYKSQDKHEKLALHHDDEADS